MPGIAWPTVGAPASSATAAASEGVFTARAISLVVHRDSVQPVPVEAAVDGVPTTDFELAAVAPGQSASYRPAVGFTTAGLEPGRYSLQARRGTAVVAAGILYMT